MKIDKQSKSVKIIGIIAIVLVGYLIIHHFTKSKPPALPAPTVIVKKPEWAEMTETVTQTGTTVAYQSVNLVARVEGYLEAIEFVDGTLIKKDQALFVIQPQPYFEQLRAANATVTGEIANNAYTKSEYARQKRMYKENATSLNNVEIWLAKTDESAASVDKSQANAEIAAINYSYTHIKSPFNGRIGRHLVDIGNLVGHGEATQLATIEQIDPLYVYFNLNEIDLIKLRDYARANGFKPADISKVPVYVSLQTEPDKKYKATLNFVNTGLNASTGTMELRALLDNKDLHFVPGLFVQVQIAVSHPQKQLTVPDTAVLYDQIGPYLLMVDQQNTVQLTHVELGSLKQGIRAITKGINAHDQVIVVGLQQAVPGNRVNIQKPEEKKAI